MPNGSRTSAILNPNLGLWLNTSALAVPDGALLAGHNFRVQNGALSNLNLGWDRFSTFTLNGPVTLIDAHFDRDSTQKMVFGTPTDLYRYDAAVDAVFFITPSYSVGTVDVSSADPAVVTTNTGTPNWQTTDIKPNDEIAFGDAAENEPGATWYVIATVDTENQLTLTTTVVGAPLTAQAYTIRRLFTGSLDTPWETALFLHEAVADEDLMFFTNGVDDIVHWNGTDDFVENAGFDFLAFHITVFKNMLIVMAVTEAGEFFPTRIRNSDVGDPLDFTNGLASAFTAHEGSDEVVSGLPLGDSLVAYSERHIVLMDFVGDPFVFVLRTGVPNLGPVTGRLVGDFGDAHSFLGPDAHYSFDGVTIEETGGQVWRDALRQRDPTRFQRAFSHFDEENGDLIWALPLLTDVVTDGGPLRAFSEHYLEETRTNITPISSRDFPFTSSGFFERQTSLTFDKITETFEETTFRWNEIFFSAAFPFNLVGNLAGEIYTVSTSQKADGVPLESFVRFGRRPTGDGVVRDLVARVYPFAGEFAAGDLAVRLRVFDSADGPLQFVDEKLFDTSLTEGAHFTSHFRAGRFFEVEFGTAEDPWRLSGFDRETRPGGRR